MECMGDGTHWGWSAWGDGVHEGLMNMRGLMNMVDCVHEGTVHVRGWCTWGGCCMGEFYPHNTSMFLLVKTIYQCKTEGGTGNGNAIKVAIKQ